MRRGLIANKNNQKKYKTNYPKVEMDNLKYTEILSLLLNDVEVTFSQVLI